MKNRTPSFRVRVSYFIRTGQSHLDSFFCLVLNLFLYCFFLRLDFLLFFFNLFAFFLSPLLCFEFLGDSTSVIICSEFIVLHRIDFIRFFEELLHLFLKRFQVRIFIFGGIGINLGSIDTDDTE